MGLGLGVVYPGFFTLSPPPPFEIQASSLAQRPSSSLLRQVNRSGFGSGRVRQSGLLEQVCFLLGGGTEAKEIVPPAEESRTQVHAIYSFECEEFWFRVILE
jgi:hypothetical protein